MIFIYILCDPITGAIRYVGQSINPKARLKAHLREKRKTHKGNWIRSVLSKKLKPELIIIDIFFTDSDANYFEIWYYEYFKMLGMDLTNEPGYLGKKSIPTPDTIEKIRRAHLGKKLSSEHKHKIGLASKKRLADPTKHGMFGRKQTQAAIQAKVDKLKGIPRSEGVKKKISASKTGKKLSNFHVQKINESHYKRAVIQYSVDDIFIKEYQSIKIASKLTGISESSIGQCCRANGKIMKGYKWQYKNKQPK